MYDDPWPLLPNLSVADVLTPTGLLDSDGNPIHRAHNPVGFGRDKEWRPTYVTTKRM